MPSEHFRERAAECLHLAQEASGPHTKFMLLEMAQVWLSLAEHSDQMTSWVATHKVPTPHDLADAQPPPPGTLNVPDSEGASQPSAGLI
jgi:hypothetical protein